MSSGSATFPAIESYAFLSDGQVGALAGPDGSVEWLCLPRFDSPSVFGAILDRRAGAFRMGAAGASAPAARRYLPGTLVVETSWQGEHGRLVVQDALLVRPDGVGEGVLLRLARCESGDVELMLECRPVFDYGRAPAAWQICEGGQSARASADISELELSLSGDLPLQLDGEVASARVRLKAGEARFASLAWGSAVPPAHVVEADARLTVTLDHWRRWLAAGRLPDGPWRQWLERSSLTLKGLIYEPTGAPLAAATTSLPEAPGGGRNWDYRYAWLRDGVFTLAALQDLGHDAEARRFIDFVCGRVAGGHELQIMYGVGGERELPESTLDHLGGYGGARPVRIGNGAAHQRQHDVWGAFLHLVERDAERRGRLDHATWEVAVPQVEAAMRHWPEPDRGVWEVRGEPRHFTSSKLMAWVALDRGVRLARRAGDAEREARWAAEAARIHDDLCTNGVDRRGVFTQSYGVAYLDASILLMPLMGFLPPDDERVRATVRAVADELTQDGLVLRYRTDSTDDGLEGEEGSFTICSFWLVSALARIGEVERARRLFERLLAHASPLGLYAEELDPRTGRHLGNMPQAFSHLALIGAALDLLAAGAG